MKVLLSPYYRWGNWRAMTCSRSVIVGIINILLNFPPSFWHRVPTSEHGFPVCRSLFYHGNIFKQMFRGRWIQLQPLKTQPQKIRYFWGQKHVQVLNCTKRRMVAEWMRVCMSGAQSQRRTKKYTIIRERWGNYRIIVTGLSHHFYSCASCLENESPLQNYLFLSSLSAEIKGTLLWRHISDLLWISMQLSHLQESLDIFM